MPLEGWHYFEYVDRSTSFGMYARNIKIIKFRDHILLQYVPCSCSTQMDVASFIDVFGISHRLIEMERFGPTDNADAHFL